MPFIGGRSMLRAISPDMPARTRARTSTYIETGTHRESPRSKARTRNTSESQQNVRVGKTPTDY